LVSERSCGLEGRRTESIKAMVHSFTSLCGLSASSFCDTVLKTSKNLSFLIILQHMSLVISYFWYQAPGIGIKCFTTQMVMTISNKGAFLKILFSPFGLL
jgi:hypothetical protein